MSIIDKDAEQYEVKFPADLSVGDYIIYNATPIKIESIVSGRGAGSIFWGEYWSVRAARKFRNPKTWKLDNIIWLYDNLPVVRIKNEPTNPN